MIFFTRYVIFVDMSYTNIKKKPYYQNSKKKLKFRVKYVIKISSENKNLTT